MSINLVNHYAQQYATVVDLLLQQKDSRLSGAVMSGSHIGKQASPVDQVGSIAMQAVTTRFGAMGRVDAPVDRRWVFPSDFDLPQLIDSFDQLRLLTDPKSAFVQNAQAAANRKKDELIINSFFDTSYTGVAGTTATTFPAGNQVAVDFGATGAVGLSVAKLREARRLLMSFNVDLKSEAIYAGITSKQHDDLLAQVQVISTDFNSQPVLVDGMVTRFLGINFIVSELFGLDANSYRRIPVWVKSGMHFGTWNGITTNISQRNDITGLPWQAYLYMTMGSTRLEENRIIEVKCSES